VRLIWFEGDLVSARRSFEQRGQEKGSVSNFDRQIAEIRAAGFPASLDCVIVPALSDSGVFLDQGQIEKIIFQEGLDIVEKQPLAV
jgi:hypothetical protein